MLLKINRRLIYNALTSGVLMPELPYIKKVEQRGDLQIWIVDGAYIRSRIDEEFTNYGQHYMYMSVTA